MHKRTTPEQRLVFNIANKKFFFLLLVLLIIKDNNNKFY